jgi:hypothetical protein
MFEWLKSVLGKPANSSMKPPWTEAGMRELTQDSPELNAFRAESGNVLHILGNPDKADIANEDLDAAAGIAVANYASKRTSHYGGHLAGYDRFLTSRRMILKSEDYLHIYDRKTETDLNCIHLFSLPTDPAKTLWARVLVDSAGKKAIVVTENTFMEETARNRWWLVREDGEWKIDYFEPIFN